jgi:hypothetical protein
MRVALQHIELHLRRGHANRCPFSIYLRASHCFCSAAAQDEGYCRTVPTTKVAHALRYLYDDRPAMSLRAIGATPEVDLHHDNVGKIRAGATAVFGTAPGAGRT